MSLLWNPVPVPVFDSVGNFAAGAQAFFYVGNSTTPLIVYSDSGLAMPFTPPVIAESLYPHGACARVFSSVRSIPSRVSDTRGSPFRVTASSFD